MDNLKQIVVTLSTDNGMHIKANVIVLLRKTNKKYVPNVSAHTKVTNVNQARVRSIKKAVKDH